MPLDPALAALGLIVGFAVGLTGMGGGALMAPLLIFIGIRPLAVVGTDLAYSTLMKLVGSAQHLRLGTVDFPTVKRLARGSLPGALLGVAILRRLPQSQVDHVITQVLGIALVLVAGTLLIGFFLPGLRPVAVGPGVLTLAGFVVGLLVGITSVGGGSLVVALLALGTMFPARTIVGTDLAHAFLLVTVAALAHWQAGNVDFGLSLNLLVGAIPGVLVGSRLSVRLPERALRPTLAVVLLATGLRLL
ncbi:MAG: sulfite exporter TauE/SafE family protein [Chloroflexi bacterium]|nr:sulfite exporter TauE/SafE family protein [Chloroflexota bacterium]